MESANVTDVRTTFSALGTPVHWPCGQLTAPSGIFFLQIEQGMYKRSPSRTSVSHTPGTKTRTSSGNQISATTPAGTPPPARFATGRAKSKPKAKDEFFTEAKQAVKHFPVAVICGLSGCHGTEMASPPSISTAANCFTTSSAVGAKIKAEPLSVCPACSPVSVHDWPSEV